MFAADQRTAIFIGNRSGALRGVPNFRELRLTRVWGLANSPLDREWQSLNIDAEYVRFDLKDKPAVLDHLARTDFDILLSNGCPFVVPLVTLRKPGRLFVNLHPSLLPRLRGTHPINGVLLTGERRAGATLHHMTDRVDAGNIIYQQGFDVTDDLDLGILYSLVFDLEAEVFNIGMQRLVASGFADAGREQSGPSSYYTRKPQDMQVDFREMSDCDIATRVRAFGIASQGAVAEVAGAPRRLLEAAPLRNPYLLSKYAAREPGTLLLTCDGYSLVKSLEGVVKVRWA